VDVIASIEFNQHPHKMAAVAVASRDFEFQHAMEVLSQRVVAAMSLAQRTLRSLSAL
jgi:hypothetical protein